MLGQKKDAATITSKRQFIEYKGFDVNGVEATGVLVAQESMNCDGYNGTLTTGVGVETWESTEYLTFEPKTTTGMPRKFFFFRADFDGETIQIPGYLTLKGFCYTFSVDSMDFVSRVQAGTNAEISTVLVNSESGVEEKLLLFTNKNLFLLTESESSFASMGQSSCGTVFQGRAVACVAPHTLVYSAPYEPLTLTGSIDGGGRIYLPAEGGIPVALREYQNKVYIFRERAIQCVDMRGAAREFKVEKVEYGGGRIRGSSVASFGKNILFLADDGVYFFDGVKAERKFENMNIRPLPLTWEEEMSDYYDCGGGAVEGKYLLRYYDVTGERTAVLYPDGKNGYFTQPLVGLSECEGLTLCYANKVICRVRNAGDLLPNCSYRFLSKPVDFQTQGRKLLKGLQFEGEGALQVSVYVDGRKKTFSVTFDENGAAEVEVMARGQTFQFEFVLEKGAILRKMRVETESL